MKSEYQTPIQTLLHSGQVKTFYLQVKKSDTILHSCSITIMNSHVVEKNSMDPDQLEFIPRIRVPRLNAGQLGPESSRPGSSRPGSTRPVKISAWPYCK